MRLCTSLFSMLIAAVILTGCASDNPPINDNSRFIGLDPVIRKSVTCSGLQETRLPDGRLKIAANLKNHENRRLEVQASCVFKDEQNFGIDETPYRTLFLDENATETLVFESFRPGVSNYTVRVRQAR